jgi:hypothetical protein
VRTKIGLSILFIMGVKTVFAQKQTQKLQQIWTSYSNQTRFSNRWGVWFDVHLRTKDDFVEDLSQLIIRPALTYYVNDATKLSAGYAYIRIYPVDGHTKVTQPEHRLWQQIQWNTKYGRNRTMQWFRLEERFRRKIQNDSTLADGYGFNFRMRYNILWQIPLSRQIEKGAFSFILNDELHINFGKQITYNYFDQNRFFLGFAYHTNETDNLQFGYLSVFQQLQAGNRYRSIDAARVSYFHNIDLRKKKGNQ